MGQNSSLGVVLSMTYPYETLKCYSDNFPEMPRYMLFQKNCETLSAKRISPYNLADTIYFQLTFYAPWMPEFDLGDPRNIRNSALAGVDLHITKARLK